MDAKHSVVIIGGGTAGIMTAAQLLNRDPDLDVAVIEPAKDHFYQAAWTLVGAGTYDYEDTRRPEESVMPEKAKWIKKRAEKFDPEHQVVTLADGSNISYDVLVVCPGIQMNVGDIEGLEEAMGKDNVCSVYLDAEYVWDVIRNFEGGGNALFTQPATAIKCGGAPQKIMYLADDHWQKSGVKESTNVIYALPGTTIFGIKEFKETLMKVVNRKEIVLKTYRKLIKVDPKTRKATYQITVSDDSQITTINDDDNRVNEELIGEAKVNIPYKMLHTAPPQSAPDFIRNSILAYQEGPSKGWLEVDKHTLQHLRYPNIFGLGDSAGLPTAKTGAAVRKQAPVVADNVMRTLKHQKEMNAGYEGYSSCPLVTGYGKMVLAEFKYDNVRDSDPLISKFVDTTKENYSMWLLKKYGLPWLYWNRMMKGKM